MKAVLISIQPKWCELIASGKKTVEVRKTAPKIATPFKVYIYCTQGKFADLGVIGHTMYEKRMKVIGEFVCDRIEDMRDVEQEPTCISVEEWLKYTDGHKGIVWGWHISDLVIYDKPKELSEFSHTQEYINGIKDSVVHWEYGIDDEIWKPMKRPPQSWCYVEELR